MNETHGYCATHSYGCIADYDVSQDVLGRSVLTGSGRTLSEGEAAIRMNTFYCTEIEVFQLE